MIKNKERLCNMQGDGFVCTLKKGHLGQHHAPNKPFDFGTFLDKCQDDPILATLFIISVLIVVCGAMLFLMIVSIHIEEKYGVQILNSSENNSSLCNCSCNEGRGAGLGYIVGMQQGYAQGVIMRR